MTITRAIPAVILLFLAAGCASMVSTQEELQNISNNEGVVIGSVLLNVEKGKENESGWAVFSGRKAGDLDWWVGIKEVGHMPWSKTYSIPVKPGKEEFFVKKLPAGSYTMINLSPAGIFAPSIYLYLDIAFTVKPGQTSYIGLLSLDFPDRVREGTPVEVLILDDQEATIEKLRDEHSAILAGTVKDLAIRRKTRR